MDWSCCAVLLEEVRGLIARASQASTPRCLSMVDAAEWLGVSPSTMKRMVKSGEILTATINKRTLVPVSELTRIATPDEHRPAQARGAKRVAWVPIPKKRATR